MLDTAAGLGSHSALTTLVWRNVTLGKLNIRLKMGLNFSKRQSGADRRQQPISHRHRSAVLLQDNACPSPPG